VILRSVVQRRQVAALRGRRHSGLRRRSALGFTAAHSTTSVPRAHPHLAGDYAFKHPLTQEVAYRSQLSDRRRHVHREVALVIEQLYPEKLDERSALVARHWEAAHQPRSEHPEAEHLDAARWNARAAAWVGSSDISQAGHGAGASVVSGRVERCNVRALP
jgi:hypothetical protein